MKNHTLNQQPMNQTKSKSGINPIVLFIVTFVFITLIFQIETWKQAIWSSALLILLLIRYNGILREVFKRVKPFLFFLPIMVLLYITFSAILSDFSLIKIAMQAGVSGGKLFLMVIAMSLFLELIDPSELLDAFRFFWFKSGLKWRWVEDFFQLIYLTFRFFPNFKEEVNNHQYFLKAFGLPESKGKIEKIKRISQHLPNLISNSLHRADNLGFAMQIRGYGKVIPRGISKSYSFHVKDFGVLFLVFMFGLEFLLFV